MESDNRTVLIIEDDADLRRLTSRLLEIEGFNVSIAENGEQALRILASQPLPQVILLDLMMPVLDGFEFRKLQLSDPSFKRIPTIVLSAAAHAEENKKKLNVQHYLKKPIEIDQLISTIELVLSQDV